MFENLIVMQKIPDDTWLTRLRRGNYFWLAKEKQFGIVEWEYESEIGFSGRIGFKRYNGLWKNETWMVRPDGKGINYSQLFLPVEGHVPQFPLTLPEPEIRKLIRQVGALTERVARLELPFKSIDFWIPKTVKTEIKDGYDSDFNAVSITRSHPIENKICDHSQCKVEFDPKIAATMTVAEVRKRFPRFFDYCPDCEKRIIKYASMLHYRMGDW